MNLAQNGSFEEGADPQGAPIGWETSGRREIAQSLTLDAGHDGGKSARLVCTKFVGGTPDSHAMICQVGKIAIARGQWYRLTFWTRGVGIARSVCQAALSKTKPWGPSGIECNFPIGPAWRRVERVFQAADDVPAEYSRLQFWFGSTGTLWLDDVVLEPIEMRVEYHPALSTSGIRNLIPNSSFECGEAGWGSYTPNLDTWSGNLYEQLGEVDDTTAARGQHSLRITLSKDRAPVYCWDYFDPIRQPIHTILAASAGWAPMQPGKRYTLSCFLKADQPGVPALLLAHESTGRNQQQRVQVGTDWERFSMTFTPPGEFAWCAMGIDLSKSSLTSAALWIDAVQLEVADSASDYAPRSEVESFISTPAVGNLFTDPAKGLAVNLFLSNDSPTVRNVRGKIVVTDYLDQEVASRDIQQDVAAGASAQIRISDLASGKRGFFRVRWGPADREAPVPPTLRCAVIDPYPHADSPFGMNHAYPWGFLLQISKSAGLTWMRDWSVKWLTVEPRQGEFDFARTDPQIDRVLTENLNALLLLPFPSTPWCSSADKDAVRKEAGGDKYQEQQCTIACPAKDPSLFKNYIARTVEHYRDRIGYYEILNEPLYTTYALPQRFGYGMKDYLRILQDAYETIKAGQPGATVIGGIGAWAGEHWVRQFIEDGGLRSCDAMDIHLYPSTIPPESYEEELAQCRESMQSRGEAKPIWLTEFGCYGDDDPWKTPGGIGDSAMSSANWPSERDASEALVKTAAVFLTHGVSKMFFHAGTCGPINGDDGGGIFFEYGGTPRKMYAALSALANLLGPAPRSLPLSRLNSRLRAYAFDTGQGAAAIVWSATEDAVRLQSAPEGVVARDMMGNAVPPDELAVGSTPFYLLASNPEVLKSALQDTDPSHRLSRMAGLPDVHRHSEENGP
ncbi:MAG: beta-galactosidase [Candidatus Sumerlaeota bacterium]|nr:beta-galactosidase [Candidatus Sumerlaeota bacterium]